MSLATYMYSTCTYSGRFPALGLIQTGAYQYCTVTLTVYASSESISILTKPRTFCIKPRHLIVSHMSALLLVVTLTGAARIRSHMITQPSRSPTRFGDLLLDFCPQSYIRNSRGLALSLAPGFRHSTFWGLQFLGNPDSSASWSARRQQPRCCIHQPRPAATWSINAANHYILTLRYNITNK